MSTLYASFVDPDQAERAAAALLDHGARAEDISILANERYAAVRAGTSPIEDLHAEQEAKGGITTTTPADAAMGAAKGTVMGMGVGAIAALAALLVPGVGLVIGGGALATAVTGAIGTAIAGAAAGGVAGYLKDQGVGDEMLTHYSSVIATGGSILAVAVPTGDMGAAEVETYLAKYGASNIATYNSPRIAVDQPMVMEKKPIEITNPNIDPVAIVQPVPATVVAESVTVDPSVPGPVVEQTIIEPVPNVVQPTTVIDASTGEESITTVTVNPVTGNVVLPDVPQNAVIRATRLDEATGRALEGYCSVPGSSEERYVRWDGTRYVYAETIGDRVSLE